MTATARIDDIAEAKAALWGPTAEERARLRAWRLAQLRGTAPQNPTYQESLRVYLAGR